MILFLVGFGFVNPSGHQPRVGATRLPWVTFPKMFSTLNGLHPFRRHRDTTPSVLFSFSRHHPA